MHQMFTSLTEVGTQLYVTYVYVRDYKYIIQRELVNEWVVSLTLALASHMADRLLHNLEGYSTIL